MNTYSFVYEETSKNKNLWKAIKCTELVIEKLAGNFKKATIIESDEKTLESVVSENADLIEAML